MGRWRAIVPILLAFVIAGVGSYFVHQWLQRQTTPPPVVTTGEKVDTTPVLVAATDIGWGTQLTGEMLKTQLFPASGVPKGHFTDPEALVGRVTRRPIAAEVPVLASLLAPETVETGGITAVINEGKRAIAVAGNKVLGLSGLIGPGNRVDVLLTTTDPETGDTVTKTVLEDLLVLAAGSQVEKGTTVLGEEKPSPVDVYTLEVTPAQAEKITLAASKGKLSFALRSYADTGIVLTRGERLGNLLAAYREEPVMIAGVSPQDIEVETPSEDEPAVDEAEPKEAESAEPVPCEPCPQEWVPPVMAPAEETVQTGPEVQVEIINGTDREVKKYKL